MLRSIIRTRRPIRAATADSPGDILRLRIWERERSRRRRRDPTREEFFVQVPESAAWLDTATMPMVLTAVAVALFAKLLMMVIHKYDASIIAKLCFLLLLLSLQIRESNKYDESKAQERLERKIQKAPPEQGTVRMLTREEWDEIQEVRPRTPFESKLARPNARLRTGEPLHLEDVKDWSIDVLTDALTRAEESAKQR